MRWLKEAIDRGDARTSVGQKLVVRGLLNCAAPRNNRTRAISSNQRTHAAHSTDFNIHTFEATSPPEITLSHLFTQSTKYKVSPPGSRARRHPISYCGRLLERLCSVPFGNHPWRLGTRGGGRRCQLYGAGSR